MKTVMIIITGRVHGVFFRRFVKEKADQFGVRGFVRNLDDGTVEVVAEGKDENVMLLVFECKRGPLHATIKDVKVEEIKNQGFDVFRIINF